MNDNLDALAMREAEIKECLDILTAVVQKALIHQLGGKIHVAILATDIEVSAPVNDMNMSAIAVAVSSSMPHDLLQMIIKGLQLTEDDGCEASHAN